MLVVKALLTPLAAAVAVGGSMLHQSIHTCNNSNDNLPAVILTVILKVILTVIMNIHVNMISYLIKNRSKIILFVSPCY
jgi:hypothetical protein